MLKNASAPTRSLYSCVLAWVTPQLRALDESIVKGVCPVHYIVNLNKLTMLRKTKLPYKLFQLHKSNISIKQIQIVIKKKKNVQINK